MSTAAPPDAPAPPPGTMHCPRCGAGVPPEQDWCMECGYHARTVIAPTPRWKVPLLIAGSIAALALAALAIAFVDLTQDPEGDPAPTVTTQVTTPPAETPPPVTTTPTVPPGTPAPGTPAPPTPAPTTPGATTPTVPTTPPPPSATPGAEPANPPATP